MGRPGRAERGGADPDAPDLAEGRRARITDTFRETRGAGTAVRRQAGGAGTAAGNAAAGRVHAPPLCSLPHGSMRRTRHRRAVSTAVNGAAACIARSGFGIHPSVSSRRGGSFGSSIADVPFRCAMESRRASPFPLGIERKNFILVILRHGCSGSGGRGARWLRGGPRRCCRRWPWRGLWPASVKWWTRPRLPAPRQRNTRKENAEVKAGRKRSGRRHRPRPVIAVVCTADAPGRAWAFEDLA